MKKRSIWIAATVAVLIVGVGLVVSLSSNTKPTNQAPLKTYVALGDSVAAGVGLQNPTDSSACDRTNQSYPAVVAQRLHYTLRSVACSGATVSNGLVGKQAVNDLLVTPQVEQLFAQPKPALITITIGANDVGWTDVIRNCYVSQCGDAEQTAAIDAKLDSLKTNFSDLLQTIHDHYKLSSPKMIVTDYYQVYPATKPGSCGSLIGISDSELSWLRDQRTKINATIKDVVTQSSSAIYADADFTGHELCADDTWVQGLTASNPYHPTAAGQAAIASHVIKALNQSK